MYMYYYEQYSKYILGYSSELSVSIIYHYYTYKRKTNGLNVTAWTLIIRGRYIVNKGVCMCLYRHSLFPIGGTSSVQAHQQWQLNRHRQKTVEEKYTYVSPGRIIIKIFFFFRAEII